MVLKGITCNFFFSKLITIGGIARLVSMSELELELSDEKKVYIDVASEGKVVRGIFDCGGGIAIKYSIYGQNVFFRKLEYGDLD